jgi:hypothetical protein
MTAVVCRVWAVILGKFARYRVVWIGATSYKSAGNSTLPNGAVISADGIARP